MGSVDSYPSLVSSQTRFTTLESPIGELHIATEGGGVSAVYFDRPRGDILRRWIRDDGSDGAPSAELGDACAQLRAYFRGELRVFALPLSMAGTPFQRRVWDALRRIPFGVTVSYGEIARWIAAPDAFRAVGAANGQNPVPIIVPCHRVIGASGALTGFGGGIERKRWLLEHEGALAVRTSRARERTSGVPQQDGRQLTLEIPAAG
jgi:methylated-DNA-[protein]-cysteine S-methyltransferase